MWRSAEKWVLVAALLLLVASGALFYRYLSSNAGSGGEEILLLKRIEVQEQRIIQLEHSIEVLRAAAVSSFEDSPSSLLAASVEDLAARIESIETTLRLDPDNALELPMLRQDLLRLESSIASLQSSNSTQQTVVYGVLSLMAALVLFLFALIVAPGVSARINRAKAHRAEDPKD